jgi:sugar/nucleoside kinase (ribokinase family)
MILFYHIFAWYNAQMDNRPIDFITIGDTVTDAFIRIIRASVHTVDGDNGSEEDLCFINGAKIPYEYAKVIPGAGNSANAAVAATRLGLSSALITDLGDDEQGREILAALRERGVHTHYVRINPGKSSLYHYILWYKSERTILIKQETFAYTLPQINTPSWIYFSSLGENSLPYHEEILTYLNEHPDVHFAFQPGTFQIKLGYEKLKALYERCTIFFCNTDEARKILNSTEHDPAKLPKLMSQLGPKITVITDGPKGLYAYEATSDTTWFVPPYPDPQPPVERTGAGDACSSTIAAMIAVGKPLDEALLYGPINSMSVVQYPGSQEGLLTRKQIEEYLAKKPENYYAHRMI